MNLSFSREPALWLGLVQAILAVVIGIFGVKLTNDQVALIMGLAAAIAAFITRANVYAPVDKAGNPIAVSK
jgi:hypothetical protein